MKFSQYWAEGFGAFFLVLAGTGAIVVDQMKPGTLGVVGVGLVFGLVVMVLVYSLGHISGAHLNPAVTMAFFFTGRFPGKEIIPYVLSQCVGAVLASAFLIFIPDHGSSLG